MTSSEIEILDIRLTDGEKPIKAFVDIRFGRWTLRDVRVLGFEGKPLTIGLPQISWKDPRDQMIKYKVLITIPKEDLQGIELVILPAFLREKEKMNGYEKR